MIAPFSLRNACRSGLLKDRLERAFCRAHRRTAMTTHPAPFQGRFYRDRTDIAPVPFPRRRLRAAKSKTPSSRMGSLKVWPRFEEVVPYAEPRHGKGRAPTSPLSGPPSKQPRGRSSPDGDAKSSAAAKQSIASPQKIRRECLSTDSKDGPEEKRKKKKPRGEAGLSRG
jgi:hypothetical protein